MQTVFRIEGVLTGDSRVVALEGRDAADRRMRLELPADEASSVAVGAVLVVHWWTAELPGESSSFGGAGPSGGPPRSEAASAANTTPAADAARSESGAEASTSASVSDRVDAEFRRLMGLR